MARAFAEDLGLSAAPISWHALRARMAEAGAWLSILIGALAKMATDVAHLASTEVGEAAEPHMPGRGGSSAMPHKRNPVSSTIILAAHAAAKGHVVTLLDAMAAAHERPAGSWHAEWHALPQLFGLASGALREGRRLAEGLEVDAAAHARQSRSHQRASVRRCRRRGARARARPRSRRTGSSKRPPTRSAGPGAICAAVLAERAREHAPALDRAFDLAPATAAAAQWVEPAIEGAERVMALLDPSSRG